MEELNNRHSWYNWYKDPKLVSEFERKAELERLREKERLEREERERLEKERKEKGSLSYKIFSIFKKDP